MFADVEESLPRLLLGLLWALVRLIAPILLLALLPPLLSLGVALLLALVTWVAVRLAWPRLARACNTLVTAGAIGFAVSVIHWAPTGWGMVLGVLLLLVGLALAATLERRLGLARSSPQPAAEATDHGASAWGGGDLLTPEGQTVRTFDWGEIAMGGPTYGSYLFPDGVLLQGLGASVRFSADGRYFAAPLPSRGTWGLLILDRQARRVYRNTEVGEFWEIDEFGAEAIVGRHSPLTCNRTYRMALADLLRQSEAVELVAVRDLWLEPGWFAEPAEREFPAPAGSHRLRGVPYLPERLRELDDPLQPLRHPALRLELDGEPSELLLAADEQPLWRADGQALVCRVGSGWPRKLWLWQAGRGWRELMEPWVAAEGEPDLCWEAPLALGETELQLDGRMTVPQLDRLRFGHALHWYFDEVEECIGHDEEGRMLLAERAGSGLVRVLPLEGDGRRGEGALLGEAMASGARPRFQWLRDSRDGRIGAYACSIGDWRLEGEWLLEHRVSDCGRHLALLAFAEAPALPHRLCVVDLLRRRLLTLQEPPLIAALLDFRAGVLSLAQIVGRLDGDEPDTPLRRYDRPAPAPEQAAAFVERDEHSRLCYRRLRLQVGETGLWPLPDWRLADRPQVANADGDFVLPAPGGLDAAWLFGAESEYRDHYPRERHPRGGGCLLTASGLAVADVGPSLIWSADGRYLALTRHIPRMRCAQPADCDQWHLLLLDLDERTLRDSGRHIGCMPQFLAFDSVLEWRVLPTDWEHESSAGEWQRCRLSLDQMLAVEARPLRACGELWLEAGELARAGQWRGLDRSHLQRWCNMA